MARAVKRRTALLLVMLVLSLVFAGWQWLRPYDWSADPTARFRMVHATIERDHSFVWLDLYLKCSGDERHDLGKPVRLLIADGREIEPAETTLEGDDDKPTKALGFRFWLAEQDFTGPIRLRLNDGSLTVRSGSGLPSIADGSPRFFTTRNW
jgi:hypothetical protein